MKKKDFAIEALMSLTQVVALYKCYLEAADAERKSKLRDFKEEYRYLYNMCMGKGNDIDSVPGLRVALVNYGFMYTVANIDNLNSLEKAAADNIVESRKRRQSALPPGEEVTVTVTKIRGRNYQAIEEEFAKALRDA